MALMGNGKRRRSALLAVLVCAAVGLGLLLWLQRGVAVKGVAGVNLSMLAQHFDVFQKGEIETWRDYEMRSDLSSKYDAVLRAVSEFIGGYTVTVNGEKWDFVPQKLAEFKETSPGEFEAGVIGGVRRAGKELPREVRFGFVQVGVKDEGGKVQIVDKPEYGVDFEKRFSMAILGVLYCVGYYEKTGQALDTTNDPMSFTWKNVAGRSLMVVSTQRGGQCEYWINLGDKRIDIEENRGS